MEKIARQSRLNSSTKIPRSATLNENDVMIIWDTFSNYIRDELSRKKGVNIPGFGTFTFVEQRLDIGNHKQLLKLKPFFLLSDKFAQTHLVEYDKEYVNTAIPVKKINFAAIYDLTKRKYSRDVIEVVINEAFIAVDHFLRSEGIISVPFNGLGILRISIVNPKPKKQAVFEFSSAMINHLPLD